LREGLHPTFNPKTFSPKKQLPAWLWVKWKTRDKANIQVLYLSTPKT
jgi:hypothetical protein